MRLLLAAVGKAKAGPELDLFSQYAKRLSPPLGLREVEEKRPLASAQLKAREAELLLAVVPSGAVVVALDERGKDMTSPELAEKIRGWRDGGTQDLAFLIGGADGHGDMVRARADLLLSFGRLTWPHMLVRALLAEQLWRSQAILAGHPYHRT
ncbi:23S rRNA (pseudouridine(1915)-N(3))-methyltransferase RlmH [Paramagnetospirillum marisnigri]|uniref:Ribosomal RNA large subunit methyltransferase H n=1 Tax=Paramagnetospirillum marisnigri TaxID=1285242 RepID=A0A178MKD6_9PROT|nr:23S rRNA (pseudouridine(1915)-N(3))-methyltransferase RlmH [Paramagnetospirillum marisnigri]OAN49202.1 23S rRNA (pseudouridine(1915)-N(3))-methyltransferase RlmH [Paramagnetospirillum marisnigri]